MDLKTMSNNLRPGQKNSDLQKEINRSRVRSK
jgi:hypothetical protein